MIKLTRIQFIFIALFFVFFLFDINCSKASTIQNQYLLVSVDDETGRFFLSTVQGKSDVQGDEKKNLLFYDQPPSSYTLIYLDDDVITFGDNKGVFKPPIANESSLKLEWNYQFISAVMNISFIPRAKTGIKDGVLIKYTVTNRDSISHFIGFRILFDTYLGENSKYHFELSDGIKLSGAKSFNKKNMPLYWVSKDRKGIVCLRGVLRANYVITPDRVVFANYKSLVENPTDYTVRRIRDFDYPPYSINDSAVALYYNSVKVKSGKSRSVYTVLGLCGDEPYKSSKPVFEVVPEHKKKEVKKETKYTVKDYKAYKKELSGISKIKSDIHALDTLLDKINRIIEERDTGKNYDFENLEKIEETLKKYQ